MGIEWLSKLMFFTDLCLHLNELNVKLQGVNKTVVIMFDLIKAFEAKLELFNQDVIFNIYKYFPYTKEFFADLKFHKKPNKVKLTKDFSGVIQSIINEFAFRFKQFEQFAETTKFILYPDKASVDRLDLKIFEWLNLEDIEIQLIDFQSSSLWKQKFIDSRNDLEIIENDRLLGIFQKNAEDEILRTWNVLPGTLSSLKKLALAILSIFSSTYACESLFSETHFIKDSLRNRMTVESSSASVLVRVTKYQPDIKHLSANMKQQKSH